MWDKHSSFFFIEEIDNSLGGEEINEINVSELISILIEGNLKF